MTKGSKQILFWLALCALLAFPVPAVLFDWAWQVVLTCLTWIKIVIFFGLQAL